MNFDALGFKVFTDPHRLQQILLNLLSNALKFTKNGVIKVVCSLVFKREHSSYALQISVIDNGLGIKKEKQGGLFKLFNTFGNEITQNSQGIGLGLAICKQISKFFGGDIEVSSVWGKGTKITYFFLLQDFQSPSDVELESDSEIEERF